MILSAQCPSQAALRRSVVAAADDCRSRYTIKKRLSCLGLIAACIALTACEKQPPAAPPKTAPSGTAGAPSNGGAGDASHPAAGVTPAPPDKPARSAAPSPAHGSTAIGGMVGNQETGGANRKNAPAPTGGDAAPGSPPRNQ